MHSQSPLDPSDPQLPTIKIRHPTAAAAAATPTPTAGARRKIGVAVDLSDESAYAVRWAVSHYIRPGDAVVLLHVSPTTVLFGADWGSIDLTLSSGEDGDQSSAVATPTKRHAKEKKLEDDFDAFTASKAADLARPLREAQIPYKIHIVKDHDMKERLCLEVERLGLSAVIMGSRGFGAVRRRSDGKLGSVSDYCVHHCVCPVVVVRYPDDAAGDIAVQKQSEDHLKAIMSSPFAMILKQNKLTGENYVDWKHNIDIVLTAENHKMVLTTPCPLEPIAESDKEERDAYAAWKRSDEVARCYILASMSNVLQQQHNKMETASDMMYSLAEMFGDQIRQAKQAAIWKLMNCRMKSGTPVRNHMLEVIGVLNDLEIMGAKIDEETKVDMVLTTLPEAFENFKLNYLMNKLNYNLTELMKELQVVDALFSDRNNKKAEAYLAVNRASISGIKGFKPKRSEKASKPSPKPKADQSVDRCHHCNHMGHWRRSCPRYLREIKDKKGKGVQ